MLNLRLLVLRVCSSLRNYTTQLAEALAMQSQSSNYNSRNSENAFETFNYGPCSFTAGCLVVVVCVFMHALLIDRALIGNQLLMAVNSTSP